MNLGAIPVKMPVLWASSAASTGNVATIPLTSQIGINDGYASLPDGFVPLNFVAVSGGGKPPRGEDYNGIFNWITAWLQWGQAGGPIRYDGTFQTSIGGYPQGAVVQSATTLGLFWLSTVDGNTTNPDAGGANWTSFQYGVPINNWWADTGAANALVITPTVPITAYTNGLTFEVNPANANTSAATLNVSGLGAKAVVNPDGSALVGGEIVAGQPMLVTYQGGSFIWINAPALAVAQITASQVVWTAGGSANALTISPTTKLSIRNGLGYTIKPSATNTGACTLDATGAAVALVRSDGSALQAGDIVNGRVFRAAYDSNVAAWRVQGTVPSQEAGSGLKTDGAGKLALSIEGLPSKGSPVGTDLIGIYDSTGAVDSQSSLTAIANYIGSVALPAGVDANAFFYGMMGG